MCVIEGREAKKAQAGERGLWKCQGWAACTGPGGFLLSCAVWLLSVQDVLPDPAPALPGTTAWGPPAVQLSWV